MGDAGRTGGGLSGRSQAIREAVGEDASLKSRDVAALDTRKSKQHVDPEVRMAEWMQTLKETGFDIRAYRDAADQRAETRTQAPGAVSQEGPDVQQAVTQAIAGLSERKVQFTYTDVLARTVGILPPENGVIERARAGIDEAISREQLIPLDREKGLFTSGIHVLDELSVRALSRDIMKQNRVTVHPEKSVPGRLVTAMRSVFWHRTVRRWPLCPGRAVQPGSVSGWLNWS